MFLTQQNDDADMDDAQASSIVTDANKIMRCLANSTRSRDQLLLETGLGGEDFGRAIKNLMQSNNPPWVEKTLDRYTLTSEGRHNLPPPAVPEWESEEVDPRKASKKISGMSPVHIRGKKGKHNVDALGRMIFKGANGKVLDAIRNASELGKKIGVDEILDKTLLTNRQVIIRCIQDLLVWRQIAEEDVNNKKTYTAVNFVEVKKIKKKPVKEKKVDAMPIVADTRPVTDLFIVKPEPAVPDHKEANEKALDDEVKALMEKYDPIDIVLSVLTKMQVKMNAQAEMIRTLV